MPAPRNRVFLAVFAAWMAVGIGLGTYLLVRHRRHPPVPPRLVTLESSDVRSLVDAFNAASGRTRVLALLSPTSRSCVRGAVALARTLDAAAGKPVAAFVVWEPVLPTDRTPPPRRELDLFEDGATPGAPPPVPIDGERTRAKEYWDPHRFVSAAMVSSKPAHGKLAHALARLGGDGVYWDFIGVFPPGVKWQGAFPAPDQEGSPVMSVVDDVRERLAALLPE